MQSNDLFLTNGQTFVEKLLSLHLSSQAIIF